MELRRPTLLLAVAVVGGVILAGCGGSDDPSGTVVQPISVGTGEEEFVPPGASNTAEASIASSIEAGTESSAESGAESGATSGAESGATSGAESGATSGAESGATWVRVRATSAAEWAAASRPGPRPAATRRRARRSS